MAPEHRKEGVATSVMEWMEREAARRGKGTHDDGGGGLDGICLFVYRTNRPAICLYEKLGYRVVDDWVDPRWKKYAEKNLTGVERKLLMIKQLR